MMDKDNLPKHVEITRVFDAPRDLVFAAWTEPKHITQWWGPEVFTTPHAEIDLRPGGRFLFQMADPDGNLYPASGIVESVDAPRSLVMISRAMEDEQGNSALEVRNVITFDEIDGKTKITMVMDVLHVLPAMYEGLTYMDIGWNQSLDKLEKHLAAAQG